MISMYDASHLITLDCGVYCLLSAKIVIPVDDVDGDVTEWKHHSENIKSRTSSSWY